MCRPREGGDPYGVSRRFGTGGNHEGQGIRVPAFAGTTSCDTAATRFAQAVACSGYCAGGLAILHSLK